MPEGPVYPNAKVSNELVYGGDNVFVIIGTVAKAIRRAYSAEEATAFTDKAFKAESYHAVLSLCEASVTVG